MRRAAASLAVFLAVFGVIGRPLGALAISLFVAVDVALRDPANALKMFFTLFALGLVLGYLWGFTLALATGLAACLAQAIVGRFSWPLAGLLGIVSGGVFCLTGELPLDARAATAGPRHAIDYAMFTFTCLVPTMLCWRFASMIVGDRSAVAPQ